ncbi:aldo/keto reductase [Streptomyces sanglieri]|uniref:aldo/keto reductase n=1 Tax=Streptomyces sanglieri TaxID=193460 RepID=UPI003525271A
MFSNDSTVWPSRGDRAVEYRRLGRTGIRVSALSLGTATLGSRWGPRWSMEPAEADALIGTALEHGINLFDTANVYNGGESEEWLGRALKQRSARDNVVLSTKFGYRTDHCDVNGGGCSRRAMTSAVEKSLTRLGTDYIDLYYVHLWDRVTAVEETLETAIDLIAQGKIRYLGLSNVPGWYLGYADGLCAGRGLPPIAAMQLNYNLLTRSLEHEYLSYAEHSGTGLVSWGPLAGGLLAGRYRVDARRRTLEGAGRLTEGVLGATLSPFRDIVERTLLRLDRLAEQTGENPARMALAWLLRNPRLTSVTLGVSTRSQLLDNLEAANAEFPDEVMASLDEVSAPSTPHPYEFLAQEFQDLVHGTPTSNAREDGQSPMHQQRTN